MSESATDSKLSEMQIVVLGCGRMGSALAAGMVRSERVEPERLVLVDARAARAEELARELDARTDLPDASDGARLWIVAVKPGDVEGALAGYADTLDEDDTIVSVAAGLELGTLRRFVGQGPAIVRAMPNTPALVGKGVTGIMGDGDVDTAAVRALFESVGSVVELEKESLFDALTAVSGSGPAYIFVALEALADGGVKMGLPREVARTLAVETVAGAAALVADDTSVHTAELKDRVASPAGTTITALAKLEEKGFRHALISAVEAAASRSRQMSDE